MNTDRMIAGVSAWLLVIALAGPAIHGTASADANDGHGSESTEGDRPNILWLSFEDMSPHFWSVYGATEIEMPTVERLAEEGIIFEQARATAPHCSPARSTLISGTPAYVWGTDWHRHNRPVPHDIYYFPELLREAGYFTSNNAKTDYNVTDWHAHQDRVWDQQGNRATYNSSAREEGQPFFAVFNQESTHMGRIRSFHIEGRRSFEEFSPEMSQLPDYVPDLPEIRSDYAFQLEAAQDLDDWIAIFVEDLQRRGLKDDTIIFIFSDHGGNLPSAKGYPFDVGYHIPMVVWVPERWAHLVELTPGECTDRSIGFEDFGPSVLGLAGVDVPEHMVGRDLLSTGSEPKEFQFLFRTNHGSHYDPAHVVNDGRFHYIRFYRPHKPLGLRQHYQWGVPGYQAWDRAYRNAPEELDPRHRQWFQPAPSEMLFDLESDPWGMVNLAEDDAYAQELTRLSQALDEHLTEVRALSFFPFYMREPAGEDIPLYDWVRRTDFPLTKLHEAAAVAGRGRVEDKAQLLEYLRSEHEAIRFWGASGFATLAQRGLIDAAPDELIHAAEQDHAHTAIAAAEALAYLDHTNIGLEVLHGYMGDDRDHVAGAAVSSLESLGDYAAPLRERLLDSPESWGTRSVLINLGVMSVDDLYEDQHEQGMDINASRRSVDSPSPDP